MYQFNYFLILSFLIGFISCNSPITEEIHINSSKSEKHDLIAKGVWMKMPLGFKRAKSYDGFQTYSMGSSISLEMSNKSLEDIRATYNPERYEGSHIKLKELRDVTYNNEGKGFLAVIYDKKNKYTRYLLAIDVYDKVYTINSFCTNEAKQNCDPKIRRSIESMYIEANKADPDDEPFLLAHLIDMKTAILTRDGKYPTNSKDNAEVIVSSIEDSDSKLDSRFLQNEFYKIDKNFEPQIRVEKLVNGKYYYGVLNSDSLKVYAAAVITKDNNLQMYKCSGNQYSNISEFEKYVRDKMLYNTIVREFR